MMIQTSYALCTPNSILLYLDYFDRVLRLLRVHVEVWTSVAFEHNHFYQFALENLILTHPTISNYRWYSFFTDLQQVAFSISLDYLDGLHHSMVLKRAMLNRCSKILTITFASNEGQVWINSLSNPIKIFLQWFIYRDS